MKLSRSTLSLRKCDPVNNGLAFREERKVSRQLLGKIAPIYLSFAILDWMSVGYKGFFGFLMLRLGAVVMSHGLYSILRGRSRYGLRFKALLLPYIYAVQYIMISNDLSFTPYFAGIAIVLLSSTVMFPLRLKVALSSYVVAVIPSFVYFCNCLYVGHNPTGALTGLTMTLGTVVMASVNSVEAREEVMARLNAATSLAKDLRNRKKEIEAKALQILRLRRLETQFSADVAKAIIESAHLMEGMNRALLCILVADIQGSTKKSTELRPYDYKQVVEEIFGIISDCCATHSVNIDKFTGDGAQAFTGFPKASESCLKRVHMAGADILALVAREQDRLTQIWNGPVNLRIGISEGEALVGMLGKGALKSFTAIGEVVSFTHRLCSKAEPNSLLLYSFVRDLQVDQSALNQLGQKVLSCKLVSGMKGFEGKSFKALEIAPSIEPDLMSSELCPRCGSLMSLGVDSMGFPKLECAKCAQEQRLAA